jgi:hypothetical protein
VEADKAKEKVEQKLSRAEARLVFEVTMI